MPSSCRLSRTKVGAVIRLPKHGGGWRVYWVTASRLGALNEEDLVELVPLDVSPGCSGKLCQVPALLLETHPEVEVVDGKWLRGKLESGEVADGE